MSKRCAKCSKSEQIYILKRCLHIFCEKCLYEYINENLDCKIKCFLPNCYKFISDPDIRKFLSTYRIDQYEKLQFTRGIIKKCLTKNCPFIYMPEGDLIFHCEYCEQPNCTKCKKRHFPTECKNNESYEEIREQNAQEAISKRKREEIEAYDLKSDLIPNFNGFECPLCCSFFCPNTQVILRTCQHEFCLDCLKETLIFKKSFKRLSCPICDTSLTPTEINKIAGKEFVDSLNKSLIQPQLYTCKYPDCKGFWDRGSQKNRNYKCPICGNINCVSCGTVHKNETCLEYQKTRPYQDYISALKNLETKRTVICNCKKLLVYDGGCGALHCDNCFEHICVFTGKLAGQSLPKGCGCSSKTPCHKDCKYGCFPEDNRERTEKMADQSLPKPAGMEFVDSLNKSVIQPASFTRKSRTSKNIRDCGSQKIRNYTCPKCGNINCVSCGTVHKNETCLENQKIRPYQDYISPWKKLQSGPMIKCFCGRMLIQKGGCGALHCDSCGIHVCAFTGKKVGNNGPDTCGCTITNPCHPDCKYGCFPE